MTERVRRALAVARNLSVDEQRELLRALSADLQKQPYDTDYKTDAATFWASPSLDELVAEQQPPTANSLGDYVAHFWPDDETADDINTFIVRQRQHDRDR